MLLNDGADATKLACFFSFTAQPAIFSHPPIACLLLPTPANQYPIFFLFLSGGGGGGGAGPADFGELSRVDMQAGLHFSLGGEWKPNCQEYLFHDPPSSEQASKQTFCCACAAWQVYYERAVWHKNLVKANGWRRINTVKECLGGYHLPQESRVACPVGWPSSSWPSFAYFWLVLVWVRIVVPVGFSSSWL
jgi:hypothetical protein